MSKQKQAKKQSKSNRDKLVLAIDSGSGSIKVALAKTDNQGVTKLDFSPDKPIKIKFAEDLECKKLMDEIVSTGHIQSAYGKTGEPLNICEVFNPNVSVAHYASSELQSSKEAYEHLDSRYGNKFSEEIQERYLHLIKEATKQAQASYPNLEFEVHLVGTAALRKADNGQHLVSALDKTLKESGEVSKTNIKIISQKDEGIYAFEGAAYALKEQDPKFVGWDIGGGSMQFTAKEGGDYKVLGGTTASSTFKAMLLKEQGKSSMDLVTPIDKENIATAVRLAKEKVSFPPEEEIWLQDKQAKGEKIVGVGNIHASLLEVMKHNDIITGTGDGYSQADLSKLIDKFANKDLEQTIALLPDSAHGFADNMLTNMILVKGSMEKYGIDSVKVVAVSNTDAIIHKAAAREAVRHEQVDAHMWVDINKTVIPHINASLPNTNVSDSNALTSLNTNFMPLASIERGITSSNPGISDQAALAAVLLKSPIGTVAKRVGALAFSGLAMASEAVSSWFNSTAPVSNQEEIKLTTEIKVSGSRNKSSTIVQEATSIESPNITINIANKTNSNKGVGI